MTFVASRCVSKVIKVNFCPSVDMQVMVMLNS